MQYKQYGWLLGGLVFVMNGAFGAAAEAEQGAFGIHMSQAAQSLLEAYKSSGRDNGLLAQLTHAVHAMAQAQIKDFRSKNPGRDTDESMQLERIVAGLASVQIIQDASESDSEEAMAEEDAAPDESSSDGGDSNVFNGSVCYQSVFKLMQEQVQANIEVIHSPAYRQLSEQRKLGMLLEMFIELERPACNAQLAYMQAAHDADLLSLSAHDALVRFRLAYQMYGNDTAQLALEASLKNDAIGGQAVRSRLEHSPCATTPRRRASLPNIGSLRLGSSGDSSPTLLAGPELCNLLASKKGAQPQSAMPPVRLMGARKRKVALIGPNERQ
ncbi:MAG TPA: hypothetical protein VGT41_01700 [Candidatus Babeliales bacterium]|nr:hypothetical protein [Candidatus Babeliales bacterium]